jgi:hypothetical protein
VAYKKSAEVGHFRADFDAAYREGALVLPTFHPHVIGMRSRIDYLDQLIFYRTAKSAFWFAAAADAARDVKSQSGMTH